MNKRALLPIACLPFAAANLLDAQTPLRTYGGSTPGAVVPAGDVNGDGFDDVLDLQPLADTVRVESGQDGSTLWTFTLPSGNSSFGQAAAGGVDCDGDGFPEIAIGSPKEVLGAGLPTGRVRLYSGRTAQLLITLDGTALATPSQYGFGTAVALLRGQSSNDARLAVGAPSGASAGAPAKGSMHIFRAQNGQELWSAYGSLGVDGFGDSYGTCVAAVDVLGNGIEHAAFGCPNVDIPVWTSAYFNAGLVVCATGLGSTLSLLGSSLQNQRLGSSIANAGDLNGDGKSDVLVGEPGFNPTGQSTPWGRIRAFSWNGSSFTNLLDVNAPFATSNFAQSMCAIRWDSDSVPDIVTGIVGGTARLLVYSGATGANILTLLDNAANSYMAGFVSNTGDINNDGRDDLFVLGTPNSPFLPSTIYSPVACTACFPNGVSFCLGIPFAGQTNCPCYNSQMGSGEGCWNHTAHGASLSGSGVVSIASDTLALTVDHVPSGSNCLFFQGTAKQSAVPFGDGLRCTGGTTIRLGVMNATGTSATYPQSGDPLVSVKGQVIAGTTYYYQVEYRDSVASWCPGSTLNMSSGYAINWQP